MAYKDSVFRPHIYSKKPTWYLNTSDNPEKRCGRCDKSTGHMLHTWFTFQIALRNSNKKGPRGGDRLEEFARGVYYVNGRFYRKQTLKNPERTNTRESYVCDMPLNGVVWTVYPKFQARHNLPDAEILLRDGYPVVVIVDGEEFAVTSESWPTMEAFLGLDQSWRKPRKRRS